jgi:hypothetical protein
LAIDRRSGEVLWSRPTDQRSILDPNEHRLPFLVAVARVNDRSRGSRKTLLVEVIDKQSGVLLGRNESLLADTLLQIRRVAGRGRVELAGMNSTVVLDFGVALPNDIAWAAEAK